MKNHPEHMGTSLAKIFGYTSFSSHWFKFSRGSLCLSSQCFIPKPCTLLLPLLLSPSVSSSLPKARPAQTFDFQTDHNILALPLSLLPVSICFLLALPGRFWGRVCLFYGVSVQHFVQQHPDLSPGFLAVPQFNSLILKQGTRGALNGTIQSPRLSR